MGFQREDPLGGHPAPGHSTTRAGRPATAGWDCVYLRFCWGEVSRRILDAKRVPAVVISSLIEKTDQPNSSSPGNDLIKIIGTLGPRNNQQFLLKVLAKKLGKQYRLSLFDESVMGQRLLSFFLRSNGVFGWGFNSFSES